MARVVFLRHAEAEEKAIGVSNIKRRLTSSGCKQACAMQRILRDVHHFIPDLVIVSDADRTAQTAALVVGGLVDTIQLQELRLMGLYEYGIVNAIIEARGEKTPFVELLTQDKENFWMRHARMVVQHLRDVIAEKRAYQILVIVHHYLQNAIGLAYHGQDHPLFTGPLFNCAEGFMINEETGIVTPVTYDSP